MQIGFERRCRERGHTQGSGHFGAQAEEAGTVPLWTFQRPLVPEDTPMEPVYQSVLDPMVALGFLAAGTSQIRLRVSR